MIKAYSKVLYDISPTPEEGRFFIPVLLSTVPFITIIT